MPMWVRSPGTFQRQSVLLSPCRPLSSSRCFGNPISVLQLCWQLASLATGQGVSVVIKGSKCSRRPVFRRLPECADCRPVGTLRSGKSSGCLPTSSTSLGAVEVVGGYSGKFCVQPLPLLRPRRVLSLMTTCSPPCPTFENRILGGDGCNRTIGTDCPEG